MYYPGNHCSYFAIFRSRTPPLMSTQPAGKLLSAHLDRPAGSRPLCSTLSIPILHQADTLPSDLDQISSSYQNTISVEHNGSTRCPNPKTIIWYSRSGSSLSNLEISPNFKASKILVRNMISCTTPAGLRKSEKPSAPWGLTDLVEYRVRQPAPVKTRSPIESIRTVQIL